MQGTTRKPGEFCWINMLTPEPAESREFWAAVLGWSYVEMPGVGHRIQVDGHDIGGMYDLNGPNTPPGTKPHIGVMVKVESADATVARINELGGKAMPAFDVFNAGRMAVCYDPTGAAFDIWEPKAMAGTDVHHGAVGAPTWYEEITTDVPRAAAFYEALFGWTSTTTPMGEFDYTTFSFDGALVAGMFPAQPRMGELRPHWGIYFNVSDVDATTALAAALGADVHIPPADIPGIGRFSGLVSPQGVWFYSIRYND